MNSNGYDFPAMFKALGDPTRLRIFRFLRACCGPVAFEKTGAVRMVEGRTIGEVCCSITGAGQISSTISHHVKELRLAGLITVERRGKNMICRTDPHAIATLAAYFQPRACECSDYCDCQTAGGSAECECMKE